MSNASKNRSPAQPGAEGTRRRFTDAQLLADLRRVGTDLGQNFLSQTDYANRGRFSFVNICRRFGSWKAALALVDSEPAHLMNVTANELIRDIRRVAKQLNTKRLRANDYTRLGKYSRKIVVRLFGRWQTAAEAAGLTPVIARPLNERELFENFKNVWQTLGHQPRYDDLKPPLSKFGVTAYTNRFCAFKKFVREFLKWQSGTRIEKVSTNRGPRTINLRLRFSILRRDHFKCRACGRSPATDPRVKLQVDHIHPWSKGGQTAEENLQTLCQWCNAGKSDSTFR